MNFTLPKNRITPIILFAIISIIVSLSLGLYQMNKITHYSYKDKLKAYDSLTDNTVFVIKQGLENTYQSLKSSSDLIAKTGELDKENIEALLPIISKDQKYLNLAIVDDKGLGYDLDGNHVNVSAQSYFIKASKGDVSVSENITYTIKNEPVNIVATPVINNGNVKGVLVAYINAQIDNMLPYENKLDQGSLVYILNINNEIMFSMQKTDFDKFDYNSIATNGFFRYEAEKMPFSNIRNLYMKDKGKDIYYLWDKKQLGMNNWSVLIGRVNNISPFSKGILQLTNMLWILMSIGMFLLFLLMIVIQRRSNQKVIRMLYLDPVTGGDNWYGFRNTVNKILSGRQSGKRNYALINFDINRFKLINDAYGYQKGDEVLKEIYLVISRWSRSGETYTRYAADQFYIFLSFKEKSEISERIHDLNDRLHQLHFITTAKINYGVYIITEQLDSVDRMGQFASISKDNNKNNSESIISYFDDIARRRLLDEESIEKTMYGALASNEFKVYLQPKYTTKGEKISGAEALVRWVNSDGSIVSPGYFIPLFEKNGFIIELDYYMLNKVCSLIRDWLDKGYKPIPVSVNISRLHFANPQLAKIIGDIVDDYKIPHNLIELELTESAFLQNKQTLIDTVILLRKDGFLVSMDDFGAGYSSLNSLKDLPLDVVKLDGELFRMTNEVERGLTVIRNTITMAKDLRMQVVAECIETREQVEYLCEVGCDLIQGYYFAKPMPTRQFEEEYLIA